MHAAANQDMQVAVQAPSTNLDWLPDHTGARRDPGLEMFAPPPPEIGEPLSGSSSLRHGKQELPIAVRVFLCAVIVTIAVVVGLSMDSWVPYFVIAIGVVTALGVWARTGFVHHCDYIGRDGLAQIEMTSRKGKRTIVVMRWMEAASLNTGETHHLRNNVYEKTDFAYGWWDAEKRPKFAIAGEYFRDGIPPNHRINFARAAERAWNQFLLPYVLDQLQREGSVAFRLGADQQKVVRVGHGFLEFHGFEAQPVRITQPEIATLSLANGYFNIKHVDARWYSGGGKFKFYYGSMPNAQLFLMMLERLLGHRL